MYVIHQDSVMNVKNKSEELDSIAQALGDPLRLMILQNLLEGTLTVSDLMSRTGAAQNRISNHLSLLRKINLVRGLRQGRQMLYELQNPNVAQFVEGLMLLSGPPPAITKESFGIREARTCYDHLAGKIGVGVFKALIEQRALIYTEEDTGTKTSPGRVDTGPGAAEVFKKFGIDTETVRQSKRKLVGACLDWTERQPHLSGSLGAALLTRMLEMEWLMKQRGNRAVILTKSGKAGLKKIFGNLIALE